MEESGLQTAEEQEENALMEQLRCVEADRCAFDNNKTRAIDENQKKLDAFQVQSG